MKSNASFLIIVFICVDACLLELLKCFVSAKLVALYYKADKKGRIRKIILSLMKYSQKRKLYGCETIKAIYITIGCSII